MQRVSVRGGIVADTRGVGGEVVELERVSWQEGDFHVKKVSLREA